MFSWPWNGLKRSRSSRTGSLRKKSRGWRKLLEGLRDRSVLLRLSVCLAAMLAMLVVVESWKAPFPFREGDMPQHGVAAKISFQRVDTIRTEQAQHNAQEHAPFVFRQRPELIDQLPQQLRADLGKIASSDTMEGLPPEVRAAFGLGVLGKDEDRNREAASFRTEVPEDRFLALKLAISSEDMLTAQQRIDDVLDDFTQMIGLLGRIGTVDSQVVRKAGITKGSKVRITSPVSLEEPIDLLLPQVQLNDRLNEAGDLGKAWLSYTGIPQTIRPALSHWLVQEAPYTLQYDAIATKELRDEALGRATTIYEAFSRGDVLVEPGEMIDRTHLDLLRDEYDAMDEQIGIMARLSRMGVVFLMILVLTILKAWYVVRNEPRFVRSLGRLGIYLAAILIAVALGRLLSFWTRAEIIPVLVTVMVFAIAYDQVLAILTAFTLSLIITLSTTTHFDQFVVLMGTAATAVIPLNRVASRSSLIKVGFYAGLTYFLTSCGVGIVQNQTLSEVFSNHILLAHAAWGAGWCLAVGYFVAGSLPIIESTFGVVTDISLLEMSDPSHPLLQELVQRAPGTYNHSIAVASIAETAAESIGANGLLVRVGAYFHDIGKMLKPQYFIENIAAGAESRHEHLAPAMSTLIIIGHVKDGVDLAERHRLPQALIDFIEQHHGTTLVEYFYRVATQQANSDPGHEHDAEESAFRYPGPKPQSREAGVLMLSDAVESASRTLSDPTPKRIESLVHGITMKRLLDGQFDECSLKLSEIRTVEQTLVKSLIAIYHTRIRYPDAPSDHRAPAVPA
ncbi:MAG: HDIG domain-containing protein [Planctomycetaceae bacterium]